MQNLTGAYILMIEPSAETSSEAVIDTLTRKMAAAMRKATSSIGYRGVHECACGEFSGNKDLFLENGQMTNSLAVHYLAFHRAAVPPTELEKVMALPNEEVEPNQEELSDPSFVDPKLAALSERLAGRGV
jgi:hypothetical protein